MIRLKFLNVLIILLSWPLFLCCKGSGGSPADQSASGIVAGAVGGVVADASTNGTLSFAAPTPQNFWKRWLVLEPTAEAGQVCPSFATPSVAGCTQVSSNTLQFSYTDCHFGSSTAVWNGILQEVDPSGSGTFMCGSYPTNSYSRQFVTASSVPGSGTRITSTGTTVTIDDVTSNLGNFNSANVNANVSTGYGDNITLGGANEIESITVNRHISSTGLFDYSITGTVNAAPSEKITNGWSVTGSVTVYNNTATAVGSSAFNSVIYQPSCCLPTSGSIQTTYQSTANSTATGLALQGKSETLTFTGCGTATLSSTAGLVTQVSEVNCF
jgi:hypothetical protein